MFLERKIIYTVPDASVAIETDETNKRLNLNTHVFVKLIFLHSTIIKPIGEMIKSAHNSQLPNAFDSHVL